MKTSIYTVLFEKLEEERIRSRVEADRQIPQCKKYGLRTLCPTYGVRGGVCSKNCPCK